MLGLDRIEADTPYQLRELALEILTNPAVTHGSHLCRMLGNGDARSAIDSLIRCDLEITEVGRYPAWLQERWGIPPGSKKNVSPPILSRENLENEYLDYILDITREDRKLYTLIMSHLNASAEASIRGSVLHRRRHRGGGIVVQPYGLSESNAAGAEVGQSICAQRRLRKERDAALAERDALRVRCDRVAEELAAASAELAHERDAAAAERERFAQDRSVLTAELQRLRGECETAARQRDAALAELARRRGRTLAACLRRLIYRRSL